MIQGYKCGSPLQVDEVALLVETRWWGMNLLKGSKVPCSAFNIDRAQFGGE